MIIIVPDEAISERRREHNEDRDDKRNNTNRAFVLGIVAFVLTHHTGPIY